RERLESVVSSTNPLIKTPVELATGRDTFRKYNVIPQYMEGAAPEEQYRESTPKPYVAAGQTALAKKLGLSPLHLELLTRSATAGGLSQFTARKPDIGRSWMSTNPITKIFMSSGSLEEEAEEEAFTKAEQKETGEQLNRRRAAERMVRDWQDKGTPKKEVSRQIASLRGKDMKLAMKVRELEDAREKGISYQDRRIASLGVESGARANYILTILRLMTTPKERTEYLDNLRRKKVLSPKVYAQIRRQLKETP
ncbi:MAG: LPD38 domain-containing protein, partial [bacterium]